MKTYKTPKIMPLMVHNPFEWYKPLSWLSTLQRTYCKTRFNHGAILIVTNNESFIVESISKGVTKTSLEKYLSYSQNRVVKTFATTGADELFIINNIGKKYQFSIWWSQFLFILTKSKRFSNINNPERWYCFELVNAAFNLGLSDNCTGADFEKMFEMQDIDLKMYLKS